MALAAGQRRGGSPGPTLLGCVQAVWRGQSSLKPFVAAGCSLLHPFFQSFHSQAQTGNLARILLPLHRQVWEKVGLFRECFERRGVHSDACAIHSTLCFHQDLVLSGSGCFDGWYNEVIGFTLRVKGDHSGS